MLQLIKSIVRYQCKVRTVDWFFYAAWVYLKSSFLQFIHSNRFDFNHYGFFKDIHSIFMYKFVKPGLSISKLNLVGRKFLKQTRAYFTNKIGIIFWCKELEFQWLVNGCKVISFTLTSKHVNWRNIDRSSSVISDLQSGTLRHNRQSLLWLLKSSVPNIFRDNKFRWSLLAK